ncbi:DUF4328 domain-containing protein [Hymenobacter terricola]|uniref:DUF4328 domain-containing protein n=1 Tax=Hymenobacter terricola TaxID=2819236 RepID=UPI001B30FA3C|nr:DUF4328 domain-containing protein [Hymenobacter terricola]
MPRILDNSQRIRFAILFQWIVVGVSLVALASRVVEYGMLQKMAAGVKVPHAQVEASDWRQQAIGSTQLVLILLAFIALVLWAHRAYGNLHRLHKAPAPRHSEGAGGWGWFVPIINFWYPYQVMKDIWNLTQRYAQPDGAPRFQRDQSLVGGWWGLRLFTIFASRGAYAPTSGATMAQIFSYVEFVMGMDVLYIWYAVTTIYMLKKLRGFEQQLAARFADDEPSPFAEELPVTPAPL